MTPEVGDILKILWKRGAISPLFRNILLPDFGVFLRVLMFDQPLHKRCLVKFYVSRPICLSKISIQQLFCSNRAFTAQTVARLGLNPRKSVRRLNDQLDMTLINALSHYHTIIVYRKFKIPTGPFLGRLYYEIQVTVIYSGYFCRCDVRVQAKVGYL